LGDSILVKKSQAKLKIRKPMKIHVYDFGTKKYDAALIGINGNHGKVKALKSDRIYFILSGKGVFIMDGKEQEVSEGDLVFVPHGTPYNIIGKMKYFLVNSPAYDPKDDIRLE
jgi:mannose-6-phosphate isomerase-like protein (cupin superfamily)